MPGDQPTSRLSGLAKYQDLFLKLLDAAFLIDPQSHLILDINPSAEQLVGSQSLAIIGLPLIQWLPTEEIKAFERNLRIVGRRYHPHTWECAWRNSENKTLAMQVVACRIQLSNGNETVQILMRDITQERLQQNQISVHIEQLEMLNVKLEGLSNTDAMTGLNNFRYFSSQMALEHSRASRYRGSYAIVFIDADNFKQYNDNNGHLAGDQLLQRLAQIIRKNCRLTDIPARYGGEEFVVLLMNVNWQAATVFAERVRKEIESTEFLNGARQPLGKVTISIGISSYPEHGKSSEEVLNASDRAVYESKRAGRNRVTAAKPVSPPA